MIYLGNDLYDIFWGYGWDNWSRVKITSDTPKPKFIRVLGYNLPFQYQIAASKYLRLPI